MSNLKLGNKKFPISNITIIVILLYLILFEYTWTSQNFIPKPSLLLEAFFSLWSEYNLSSALIETTAVIFPTLFLAVVLIEVFSQFILGMILKYEGILNITAPFKYFSFFFFALVINLYYPQSFWVEFIFAVFFIFFKMIKKIAEEKKLIQEEYVVAAKSMGLSESKILSEVVWRNLMPKFYEELPAIHAQLWIAVLIYEFISASIGLGSIYRMAFDFNDLSGVFALGIFLSLMILIVNLILKFMISKLIFWK